LAGCHWEIYITTLSEAFNGIVFSNLTSIFYQKFGIVLFALQITDRFHGDYSKVLLFPANYVIPTDRDQYQIEVFVIAQNQIQANLPSQESVGSRRKSTNSKDNNKSEQEFSIPDGYQITEKQVLRKVHPEGYEDDIEGKKNDVESGGHGTRQFSSSGRYNSMRAGVSRKMTRWHQLRKSAFSFNSLTYEETLNSLQNRHILSHYYAHPTPIDIEQVTIKNYICDEIPDLSNHLIIIGKIALNWYDLIKPLRARCLGPLRPIVLLYPSTIASDIWHRIGIFEGIYFVKGSPLEEVNLLRAGIFRASQVIILADGSGNHLVEKNFHDEAVDSDAIFAYHFVTRMNPSIKIVLEVINPSNIAYLDRSLEDTRISNYLLSPNFASGILFPTSLLDSIVCQSYYNPHIVKVFSRFLVGPEESNHLDLAIDAAKLLIQHNSDHSSNTAAPLDLPILLKEDSSIRSIEGSCFYQMKVTKDLLRKPYERVFRELTKKGILPLAIMRGTISDGQPGPTGNFSPYIYTNPFPYAELYLCDSLFVLSVQPIVTTNNNSKSHMAPPSTNFSPFQSPSSTNNSKGNVDTKSNSKPLAAVSSSDGSEKVFPFMSSDGKLTSFSNNIPTTVEEEKDNLDEKLKTVVQQMNNEMNIKFDQMWKIINQNHMQLMNQIQVSSFPSPERQKQIPSAYRHLQSFSHDGKFFVFSLFIF
jgi:hypothetical protein